MNALKVEPPFTEYHFVDLDGGKAKHLRERCKGNPRVIVYEGDCNRVLVNDIFPRIQYKDFRRGLCLLDPYGLQLDWNVIQTAGQMRSIEIFVNFPIMDMNRNVLRRNPDTVAPEDIARMNEFWGDSSWKDAAYKKEKSLFDGVDIEEKNANAAIVNAFRKRLKEVAGFAVVPEPMPMRNSKGAEVYYLFFASPKPVAGSIVTDIMNKYRSIGKK